MTLATDRSLAMRSNLCSLLSVDFLVLLAFSVMVFMIYPFWLLIVSNLGFSGTHTLYAEVLIA
jgi:hypothetical protein